MKKLLTTMGLTTVLALSSSTLLAKYNHSNNSFEDTARVTHVEPLYKTVRVSTPQRECWQQQQQRSSYNQHKSYTGTIAGGIVGGLVGNQFGGGSGKKVMTVAGALLGGSVGRDLGHKPKQHGNYDTIERCSMVDRYHQEERHDGYRVTYRYKGQSYTTHMNNHPGQRITVAVSVRPVINYY